MSEDMQFITSDSAYKTAIKDIAARQDGSIVPISTGWPSLDSEYFDGFERGWIITISGSSGTGKTAFLAQMLDQISAVNDFPIAYLTFSFEMRPDRMLKRNICRHYGVTMSDLYKIGGSKGVNKKIFDKMRKEKLPLLGPTSMYVERPMYPEDIKAHIARFREALYRKKGMPMTTPMVVSIDHLLLAKNGTQKRGIDDVMLMQNEFKKIDPNVIFINITQLNREYDSVSRHDPEEPAKHYPVKSDLYGSDIIWMTSDAVIVLSNPKKSGLTYYGMDKYSTFDYVEELPFVFAHNLKNRDAGQGGSVTPFVYDGPHFLFKEATRAYKKEDHTEEEEETDELPI